MTERSFVKLGFTFEYFMHGVILIVIGLVCYLFNVIFATMILLVGIALLLVRSGIEIDSNFKKVRKYYEFFSLRFGTWVSVEKFQRIELRQTKESQTFVSRSGQKTFETKTYDIVLIDKTGFYIELNDFTNYNVAVETLALISKTFSMESVNQVVEIRKNAIERRKDKNYRK